MATYNKETFKRLFQYKFNLSKWQMLLQDYFHADKVRVNAEVLDEDAEDRKGYFLGSMTTQDNYELGFFYYEMEDGSVLRRKVGLRNLIRPYLGYGFDAALAVFNDGINWRLSLICDLKEDATSTKRFTYVFGDEKAYYKTPVSRFVSLQKKANEFLEIKKAFSVEALSDDFFAAYRKQYAEFVKFLTGKEYVKKGNKWVEQETGEPDVQYFTSFKEDDKLVRDYIKKMMGRIVFLYFLQSKGWLAGNLHYMHDLFYDASDEVKGDFLDKVLEPMFFGLLNTKPEDRSSAPMVNGVGVKYIPNADEIPYLNGGLFQQEKIDEVDSVFPAGMFQSLFDFFDSYNFTIDENDPNDAEVGVDPEMLGKIFENLLEDNKDKGAFYTPKEIVRYMCQESLTAYLQTGIDDADIKRHIIQNNIYGVDIEKGAVDIARLRFWLALIIDEKEPMPLPNLDFKIMQGNSLLESYKGVDLDVTSKKLKTGKDTKKTRGVLSLGFEETDVQKTIQDLVKSYFSITDHTLRAQRRQQIDKYVKDYIKVCAEGNHEVQDAVDELEIPNDQFFLWHTYFADVFEKGGFDIVIGNPPYISAPAQVANEGLALQRERIVQCGYYETLYQKWDLYVPFMERGLKMLNKGGSFSMIVPFPLSNQLYGKKFRKWVWDNYRVSEIVDLNGTKIFDNATVSNLILFAQNSISNGKVIISNINEEKEIFHVFEQEYCNLIQDESKLVWNFTKDERSKNRHSSMLTLGDYCYISVGMVLNADEKTAKGEFAKEDLISSIKDSLHPREYVESKDIGRYIIKNERYLEYDTERCPNKLRRPTFRELYNCDKLVINRLGSLQVMIDDTVHYLQSDSSFMAILWRSLCSVENKSIKASIKRYSHHTREEMETYSDNVCLEYLLSILNSKYAIVLLANQRGDDYHIYPEHLRNMPIAPASIEQQEVLRALVKEIVQKKKDGLDTSALENRIDFLVYHLYGLTYDEVLIVDPETPISREEYEAYNIEQ